MLQGGARLSTGASSTTNKDSSPNKKSQTADMNDCGECCEEEKDEQLDEAPSGITFKSFDI